MISVKPDKDLFTIQAEQGTQKARQTNALRTLGTIGGLASSAVLANQAINTASNRQLGKTIRAKASDLVQKAKPSPEKRIGKAITATKAKATSAAAVVAKKAAPVTSRVKVAQTFVQNKAKQAGQFVAKKAAPVTSRVKAAQTFVQNKAKQAGQFVAKKAVSAGSTLSNKVAGMNKKVKTAAVVGGALLTAMAVHKDGQLKGIDKAAK